MLLFGFFDIPHFLDDFHCPNMCNRFSVAKCHFSAYFTGLKETALRILFSDSHDSRVWSSKRSTIDIGIILLKIILSIL